MPLQSVGKGENYGEDANKDHDSDNEKVKVADSEQQLHEPVVLGVLLFAGIAFLWVEYDVAVNEDGEEKEFLEGLEDPFGVACLEALVELASEFVEVEEAEEKCVGEVDLQPAIHVHVALLLFIYKSRN